MMKKRIAVFLLIITIVLSYTGCATPSDTGDLTEKPGVHTTHPPEESQGKNILSESAIKTDVKGLYSWENGVSYKTYNHDVSISDDVLRMEFITPGLDTFSMDIVQYSLSEDKVLGKISLPEGMWVTGSLKDGGFYTISLSSAEVTFYDRNCKKTSEKKVSEKGFSWSTAQVSNDGKYLLYNRLMDGSLVLHNLTTGEEDEASPENSAFELLGYGNDSFYVRSYESGIFRIFPAENEIESITGKENNDLVTFDYAIDELNYYFVLTLMGDPEDRKMTSMMDDDEIPMAASSKYFATLASGQKISNVRVYNIGQSCVTPELPIPGYVLNLLFIGEDLLLIASQNSETEEISYYLYDITEVLGFESIVISKADDYILSGIEVPEWTGDTKTIELGKSILEKYGVRIVYWSSAIESEKFSYSSKPIDISDAYAIMQQIEEVLKFFPEGMTHEMGRGHEVWIYLCKELASMDNKQTVQGFTLLMGRYTIIYIDTEGSSEIFKEILVHEFSHVIDYSISKSLLNGWIELLPQNIAEKAYLNSYQADYSLDYTTYGKGSLDVWFYDGYSRTFPTEDRAVIFQKMYYSHTEGKMTDEFKNHENLRKKARYYCVMLRRTFESCKNAETLPWEELFGKIDITEFD